MWQFSSSEIVFGEDALSRLNEITGGKAFVVTDATIVGLGFLEYIREQLAPTGITIEIFDRVEPEPSIQTVLEAKQAITDFEPDLILALGGGSVLDAAKVAWLLYERPNIQLEEINIFSSYGVGRSRLITIPTTSGTGADVTMGAVLTDPDQKRKIVIYAREFQPYLTIVDPIFAMAMPAQITADTGMDVVSHAVEAFGSPWHNDFSDGLAVEAMRLVLDYLPRAFADGTDTEAREHMHNASTIAGLAINNASVSLGHALAHSFGAIFSFPHGRVVGMLLPYSIEYTANGGGSRYSEMTRMLGFPMSNEVDGVTTLVKTIRKLAKKLHQPTSIRDLGISQADLAAAIPNLVCNAAEDHQMLTTLRVPDDRDLERLYWYAYEGETIDF